MVNLEKEIFSPSTLYYANNPLTVKNNFLKIIDELNNQNVNWSKHTYVNSEDLCFDSYVKKALNQRI